jgi:hypothetical protein
MAASTSSVRLKSIAIPPEHGAWGFLLEPILLGLLIAPTLSGLLLSVAVAGAFLARHPLKIALVDRQRGKRFARTALAERIALAYLIPAALAFAGAVVIAGVEMLWPWLIAAPLAAIMFISYAQNRGRELLPELAGASALAVTASSLALAGDEAAGTALALWAILTARDAPSILYVRARLRLEKEKPYSLALVLAANALGVITVLALAVAGLAPALAVVALIILAARAAYGLSPYRRRVRTQTIGVMEIGYGLMTALLTAIGYATGL